MVPDRQLTLSQYSELMNDVVARARVVQKSWSALSVVERVKPLKAMREMLSAEARSFAAAIAAENGKTELEALTQEIVPTLDVLDFLAKNAVTILADKPHKIATRQLYFRGKEAKVVREPYGVIGILGTWNYAFYLSFSQALFALTAGNAVVLKAAEFSSVVTDHIRELATRAGYPADLFYAAAAGSGAGEALCRAKCDKYILTGSRRTGQAVLGILAQELKPAIVELSGCDPYIVLDDADMDLAARSVLWAAFQYSGQTCVAPRRVFVSPASRAAFLAALKKHWNENAEFLSHQGFLRAPLQAGMDEEKVRRLKQAGAVLELGQEPVAGAKSPSAYFAPRVFSGVKAKDLKSEDFMSPVIFIIESANEDEMLAQVNDSEFALGASVWTQDRAHAERWAKAVTAGQVWINDAIYSVALAEAPFGGHKDSGFGTTRGAEGLLEMTRLKFITAEWRSSAKRSRRHLPPYDPRSFEIVLCLQRLFFADTWKIRIHAITSLMRVLMKPKKKS